MPRQAFRTTIVRGLLDLLATAPFLLLRQGAAACRRTHTVHGYSEQG